VAGGFEERTTVILSFTTDAASNWDDRWSAGYLTTQSRLDTIFPTLSDQKAVMTECAADVVVGQEKEYANSSCQR